MIKQVVLLVLLLLSNQCFAASSEILLEVMRSPNSWRQMRMQEEQQATQIRLMEAQRRQIEAQTQYLQYLQQQSQERKQPYWTKEKDREFWAKAGLITE